MAVAGLVLAAGAGTRFGGPKALARGDDGTPWAARAAGLLADAGCDPVLVTLGASADRARALLPAGAVPVVVEDWRAGIGVSLATGLNALPDTDAVLVTLVDLPGLPLEVLRRVLDLGPVTRGVLRRAVYAGRPGHPVLIGADHWAPLADSLAGDTGGRDYLDAQGVDRVECADAWSGRDIDVRPT